MIYHVISSSKPGCVQASLGLLSSQEHSDQGHEHNVSCTCEWTGRKAFKIDQQIQNTFRISVQNRGATYYVTEA